MLRSLRLPDVDVLVCTGSNQALLPSILSRLRGAEVVCIEAVDRIVSRSRTVSVLHDYFGVRVIIHWPQQRRLYKNSVLLGPLYPKPVCDSREEGDFVLVITGSAGNPRLIKHLISLNVSKVFLQIGRCCDISLLKKVRPSWRIFRFHPEIERLICRAKLVLVHQGLTLVETVLGYKKRALFIFNPDLPLTSTFEDAVQLSELLRVPLIKDYEELRSYLDN